MQTIEHLRHLFEYDDWANRRVIATLRKHDSERCRQILAHLLTTKQEYFDRLHGKDSTGFNFWPDLSLDECADLSTQTKERFEKLLARFDDEGLGMKAAYKTSEGVLHSNTFREILTHVLFHSAIHRGNIILKLREEGIEPPQTDYIIYLRETK
jgi:uncharacterized damage-inducible protein DinB